MAFHRDVDPVGRDGLNPAADTGGAHELRRDRRAGHLGDGTLACPSCDFPTRPTAARMTPVDPLWCSFCGHHGPVRDFLTLTPEPRPARVRVVVRVPALRPR